MIHVAIILPKYAQLLLSGIKTIESRLTNTARAPFELIEKGERIYFKVSAGEFCATAIAEHIIFMRELNQSKIKRMKKDYNHGIMGESSFWENKRRSKYATLIWLNEIEPVKYGPQVSPQRGIAWLRLDNKLDVYPQCLEPIEKIDKEDKATKGIMVKKSLSAKKKSDIIIENNNCQSFRVPLTAGNLKNNHVYVRTIKCFLPDDALGGNTKNDRGKLLTLLLDKGAVLETDIVESRGIFRNRSWGSWFADNNAQPGDLLEFSKQDLRSYKVKIIKS